MPHLKRTLLVAARRVSLSAALLCIGGCPGFPGDASPSSGEIVVILASPRPAGAVILASPADPSTTPSTPSATSQDGAAGVAVPRVAPDTAALYLALSDSAEQCDGAFQREREALNREALAMRSVNRTSAEYHSRYQAFERRSTDALALRRERDRLRARIASLRARHPELANAPAAESRRRPPRSDARAPMRAAADRDTVTLSLEAGDWWLSLASGSTTGARPTRITLRKGASDTIRLR